MHHPAPHCWTADCTILIPTPQRAKADSAPHVTLRLHTEHLAARSACFRGLFSGVSPLHNPCASRHPLRIPQSRLPRLLPSPPSHPVVFLPVPDPSSIQPLFHWMYFGNTDHIENALDQGDIQWQGLARNVEYLGLSTDIKVFLGRWYRNWLLPAPRYSDCVPCPMDDDDDSALDEDCGDSDSDDYYSPSIPPSDDECDRGRTRDVKPLVQLCGRLRLRTTDL